VRNHLPFYVPWSVTPYSAAAAFFGRWLLCGLGFSGSLNGCRCCLFRCGLCRRADSENLQNRQALAVAIATTIIVTATLLEDDDLVTATLGQDFGRNRKACGRLHFASIACEKNVIQRHRVARFTSEFLNDDLVSGGDAVLLAASAHDCEHGYLSLLL